MKKNAEYVGIDEKFIPEEEKYVDNENEMKVEKTKKTILKGIGIGYIVFFLVFIIIFLLVLYFIITVFNKF